MDARTTEPPDVWKLLATDDVLLGRLLGYARCKRTRIAARAEDVAQEAIARVLEGRGWYRWDPARKSLLDHLCNVVDTVVANENRRAFVKRQQPITEADEQEPDSTPCAEQQIDDIEESEREQRLAEKILQRVADDEIIPRMLQQEEQGIEKASELAAVLQRDVKEIYRARERLAHHREQVLEEERKREVQRMKGHPSPP